VITFEALDVILRVQNLPGFMARLRTGAMGVKQFGAAAVNANKSASTAFMSIAKKSTFAIAAAATIATATGYKMSVEFQKQMTLVHTQAGAFESDMGRLNKGVLELARTLPQGPLELAKGLYHIESIGIRNPTKALAALKVAAEGAAVGGADLEQTTSALGAAWLAAIPGAGSLRNTMAILNATVGAGNMRMDELVTALGSGVLPTAKLAGLQIQDVMGALALLKDEGYGAYGAMAQFATALHFFTSPTEKAKKAFKQLGLADLDLADTMRKRGMVATLQLLHDRLQLTGDELARSAKNNWSPKTQQEQILGAILPGGRGRVFRVLLNQIDRYQLKLNQIDRTTGKFGKSITDTQKTAAYKLHAAWSSVQVDLILLGAAVRGPVTTALVYVIGVFDQFLRLLLGIPAAVRAMIDIWNGLPAPLKLIIAYIGMYLATLAAIKGYTLIIIILVKAWNLLRYAIFLARYAMLLFMDNPIIAVIAAIGLAIMLLITHWKQVKAFLGELWDWIKNHWRLLLPILFGPFGIAVAMIITHWRQIKRFFIGLFNWFKGLGIVQFFVGLINSAAKFFGIVHNNTNNPKATAHTLAVLKSQRAHQIPRGGLPGSGIRGGWTGGMVTSGGVMDVGEHGTERIYVPTGSYIKPAGFQSHPGGSMSRNATSGDVIEMHVHSYLDGKEVSETVSRHMATKKARK
jgi:TP901 family phage tail tape measure protein